MEQKDKDIIDEGFTEEQDVRGRIEGFPWGVAVLAAAGVWAVVELVLSVLYFFN